MTDILKLSIAGISTKADWLTARFPSVQFEVFTPSTEWKCGPGVYIFARIHDEIWAWEAIYVGETTNFKTRLPDHERWAEAVRLGATHIHLRVVPEEIARMKLEAELIQACQPPLNTHHR